MTSRPLKRLTNKPALRREDLDQAIGQLREDMTQAAEKLAHDTALPAGDDDDADVSSHPFDVPELADWAETALRELLEEETYALIEPEGDRGIHEHELHHEIQKRALVGLKRKTLVDLAARRGMAPAGNLDDLAGQIAASYDWDEQAIARLVLDYAEDPRVTDGGPVTRVFVLDEPLNLPWTIERLKYVDGRYYRTDIAKWFVFERFTADRTSLRAEGRLQTYAAGVDPLDEEKLTSSESRFDAQLEVRADSAIAVVHWAANATVARSVLSAFKVATLSEHKRYVPSTGTDATARPNALHPTTEWLLNLTSNRLQGPLFRNRNVVLARFKLGKARPIEQSASRKPNLSAVRFEGDNLLASSTASSLMWTEGRPLVDLTLDVSPIVSEIDTTTRGTLTVRVAVERDHVSVSTGLHSDVSLMNQVHRAVVTQVCSAISAPPSEESVALVRAKVRAQVEVPDPDADDTLFEDTPLGTPKPQS